jgi:hypothetical protein
MIDFMFTDWKPMYFGPTPEEIQKSWTGKGKYYKSYDELEKGCQSLILFTQNPRLFSTSYECVRRLEDDMIDFRNYYCKMIGFHVPFGDGTYSSNLEMIANVKKELLIKENPDAALYYSEEAVVVITEDEKVNGYVLYPIDKEIMEYDLFIELRRCADRFIPDEEFLE